MNKATVIYIAMIAALSAGLWLIITFGGALTAPEDLSGVWETISADGEAKSVRIEQSGIFFEISIDGTTTAMKMTRRTQGRDRQVVLSGDEMTLTILGLRGSNERDFEIVQNDVSHVLHVRRANRMKSLRPTSAAEGPNPAPTTEPVAQNESR
jgi:hypothetical protein